MDSINLKPDLLNVKQNTSDWVKNRFLTFLLLIKLAQISWDVYFLPNNLYVQFERKNPAHIKDKLLCCHLAGEQHPGSFLVLQSDLHFILILIIGANVSKVQQFCSLLDSQTVSPHLSWLHPLAVPSEKLPWEQEEHEDFLCEGCHIVEPESIKSGGVTAKQMQTLFANLSNFIYNVLLGYFWPELLVLYDEDTVDWIRHILAHQFGKHE